jgi:hypothetical protein
MSNAVDHPQHYTSHPSGVEAVEITEWLSFNLGNCVKYLLRREHKGHERQDMEKALWYARREKARSRPEPVAPAPFDLIHKVTRVVSAEPDQDVGRAIGLFALAAWSGSGERDLQMSIRILEERLS